MSKTSPANLAEELLGLALNGDWNDTPERLRLLAQANPNAAIATAFYLGQYSHGYRDKYTAGRLGRLLSDDVDNFENPTN